MDDLTALFRSLPVIAGADDCYAVQTVGTRERYRVGRDPGGNPALLISTQPVNQRTSALPLEFSNLSFRPRCQCRVRQDTLPESIQTLAVLKCTTDDPALRDYFLRSLSGALDVLPDIPTEQTLVEAVSKLVELFRALEAPPRKSLQGLWCELFLISRSTRIRQAALAWHSDPTALFDFSAGTERLEVKSAVGGIRRHYFSLQQLTPPHGTDALVASFLLDESGGGLSIAALWEEVAGRRELTSEAKNRLLHVLTIGLGRDWRKANRIAFDPDIALRDLRLYEATAVPKVSPSVPVGVSEVHFCSELTDVPTVSLAAASHRGGLFQAIFQQTK
jgi:hypothetical protein